MTMENKALVYAVLAISLGYLLVSAVPSRLASPMLLESGDNSEVIRGPTPESPDAPVEGVPEMDTSQGDILSAGEAVQEESLVAGRGSGNLIVSVVGTWSVNLLVALGVYFIARRRFT